MPIPEEAPARLQALVGGLHVAPALIAQDRFQSGVHIELNPLGCRSLLGVRAAELTGHVVGLGDLGSPGLATLPQRLAEAHGWQTHFAILDEMLAAEVADAARPAPEVG